MVTDFPRAALSQLVDRFGVGLGDDARRCEVLLGEACGDQFGEECAALVAAIEQGITGDLLKLTSLPKGTLLERLSHRLETNCGLSPYLARWSVECWAVALGTVPASDRLMIVKLEGLAPLIDRLPAEGAVGAGAFDRLVDEAQRRGISEADARAYLQKQLAANGLQSGAAAAGTPDKADLGATATQPREPSPAQAAIELVNSR